MRNRPRFSDVDVEWRAKYGVHSCSPYRVGYCPPCQLLAAMTPEEFVDWFAKEHSRPRCTVDPSHLVGSYFHARHCVGVA